MKVFSLKRFVISRQFNLCQRIVSLQDGWPQQCNGKSVEQLKQDGYIILDGWVKDKKERHNENKAT